MALLRKRVARRTDVQVAAAEELEGKRLPTPKASLPSQYSATGRPVRQRKRPLVTDMVDVTAVEDDFVNVTESESEIDQPTQRVNNKKRKRSPPPSLTPDRFLDPSTSSASYPSTPLSLQTNVPVLAPTSTPISLTFNIPAGFQGPLTINIDANNLLRTPPLSQQTAAASKYASPAPSSIAMPQRKRAGSIVSRSLPGKVGFLDLPPEIRNEIYRSAFIKDQRRINFSTPSQFQRSTALLRTCRQVAHEGASILYSECEYYFRRNTSSRTPLWTTDSKEIGFSDVHRFLKMIGSTNVARLRHVFFLLEDAVPCLNPQFKTAEERRYVHDEHLKAALRIIADHGRLQTLKLGFFGRRNVAESDSNFLNEIKGIKADSVEVLARRCHPDWPRLYSNLQWPKIFFHLALDVKTAVTRKKKFYLPWKEGKKDFFEDDSEEESREARLCRDCGDVHV
ncbi:Nuclear elongation and deformation protein 1 [Sphaceloma murrayae]|uniref:Nuclear elongation and deformation protein 1 n=1 Tax=Sphaceloma murrayae TaxID=2082308 RepID=A0A2K1QKE1_9PEZI|nr:Nuclear elongation and deformation protein 1 [Sphaceloma murrayae]